MGRSLARIDATARLGMSYDARVKVLTAKVADGLLDVPEGILRDGDTVTLLVPEPEETGFRLSEEQQALLRAAILEADEGRSVDGWQLLDEIRP